MKAEFKINGTRIKTPHSFKMSFYNITESNRIQNGDMSMELIAQKQKFFFSYEAIDSVELNKILQILWRAKQVMVTLSYVEDNVARTATVYSGEIAKTLVRTSVEGGPWVYKDFTFNLVER